MKNDIRVAPTPVNAAGGRRRAGALCATLVALAGWGSVGSTMVAADTAPPSGIGSDAPFSISVSPAFAQTGLVAVMAVPFGGPKRPSPPPGKSAADLFISHDGGHSWRLSNAIGWSGAKPEIAVDGTGNEILYATAKDSIIRSRDYGETWQADAPGSTVTAMPLPTYAKDPALAVTSKNDFLARNGTASPITGSGGAYTDWAFGFPATYPSTGNRAAALLTAVDKNGLPVVLQCKANLDCSAGVSLPGASSKSIPAIAHLSEGWADDGVAFIQSGQGIYRSIDGGTTFVPLAITPSNGAAAVATPGLALAPGYRDQGPVRTAYAAVLAIYTDPKNPHSTGGVFRSDDGGTTWNQAGANTLDGGAMSVATSPTGRVFGGYLKTGGGQSSAGLLCSDDSGNTWKASCPVVGHYHGAVAGKPAGAAAAQPCAASCVKPLGSPASSPGVAAGGDAVSSALSGLAISSPSPSAGPVGAILGSRTQLVPWLGAGLAGIAIVAAGVAVWWRRRRGSLGAGK